MDKPILLFVMQVTVWACCYRNMSGVADVVFAIDTTGSMSSGIRNVKNYIEIFVDELAGRKIDVKLGLIEYRDIYADGIDTTINYGWFSDVNAFKNKVEGLYASGGGDTPESAVDAVYSASEMSFRTGVPKYIVIVTDAGWKIGTVSDSTADMNSAIDKIKRKNISVSVVTELGSFSSYSSLTSSTNGILANISEDFAEALMPLILNMKEVSSEGCWVRLSNGTVVQLDKDPNERDESVDTDEDGIPDIYELIDMKICRVYDSEKKTMLIWKHGILLVILQMRILMGTAYLIVRKYTLNFLKADLQLIIYHIHA